VLQGLIESGHGADARQETAMPVSKKRKKDGKPVHRAAPAREAAPAEPVAGQVAEPVVPKHGGRPTNPFVAAQQAQARRASQRGR
jgi:hypothetical protein